jgi:hypothetical protein
MNEQYPRINFKCCAMNDGSIFVDKTGRNYEIVDTMPPKAKLVKINFKGDSK